MTAALAAQVVEVLAVLAAGALVARELLLCWRVRRSSAASLQELARLEARAVAGDELAMRRILNLARGRRR